MRIAVWKTGHEIADTVADALAEGLPNAAIISAPRDSGDSNFNAAFVAYADLNIGYGILRGNYLMINYPNPFFLDRGYLNPGHYDGYYRISYQGTQARWHMGIPRKPIDIKLDPWRPREWKTTLLICPPTPEVSKFFGIDYYAWMDKALNEAKNYRHYRVRKKGDPVDLDIQLSQTDAVITFNSSVGWQALQRGVPALSDPEHSIIGSYYASKGLTDLQSLTEKLAEMPDTRLELFEAMAAHQFTLQEIREGKAWGLIKHYTQFISGSTPGKPSLPRYAATPSSNIPNPTFTSNFSSTAT